MKRFISFILCAVIAFSLIPVNAFAADNVITITKKQMTSNASKYIEAALKEAKKNATDKVPYTITLPSGSYSLKSSLHIFSNTNLVLQEDTELIKVFSDGNMLKLGVKEEKNYGYDGYRNITISGGVWNCNFTGTSCIMRFAHCKNIVLKNTTLKNQKNAHHMELAGAKSFKITNCSFEDFVQTGGGDGEAIHIDPIHNTYHFPSYYEYDDTPCKNITVDRCTFKNLFAGVGTRSGVVGSYFDTIKITNNKFENIQDKAICAFNYRNSVISGNTIENATIGIIFEYFPASNLLGKLYMPNSSESSTKIIKNSNCKIKNNTVKVKNSTGRENSSGIAVYGGYISKDYSRETGLKAGNYSVEGLSVYNNNISVLSSSSFGFILEYVSKSRLYKNKIASEVKKSAADGISMYKCRNDKVSNNTVSGFNYGIINYEKSRDNTYKSNEIKKNRKVAIALDKTSRAEIYYTDRISGNKKGKYYINGKKYPLYAKYPELTVKKGKKKNELSWNRVKKTSGYMIYRSTKKKSGYKLIATVKGNKNTVYTDKHKKGEKYYYKIRVYKSVHKSKIYGNLSEPVK